MQHGMQAQQINLYMNENKIKFQFPFKIKNIIYPTTQSPKPRSQEMVDGSALILVVIVAWQ